MKKIASAIFILALLFSATAFSQTWKYDGTPDTSLQGNTHAIAVDPAGKVWFGDYYATDSIKASDGTYPKVRDIYVYNADGTPASFNKMQTITVGGVTDTLWNSNRGANLYNDGNVLWASYATVYLLNYMTGEGMNKFTMNTFSLGCTAPVADSLGDIFVRDVAPGYPILSYDNSFGYTGNAIDTAAGYSRTMAVSKDGNTIYNVGYTNNAIIVYQRPDEFSKYVAVDTILKGFACESIAWNPKTGYLWASSGSNDGQPNNYADTTTSYTYNTWYAYDVNTKTIMDSLHWHYRFSADSTAATDPRPRAIAFSPTGDTAYVGCFNNPRSYMVERFVNTATAVKNEPSNVIKNYALSQNYPNPFNPTTEINYTVAKAGFVTLRVYDILGREVANLVNGYKNAGNFNVNFNASRLASGTYIYQMSVNGVTISKKMVLLK
ncbi:MAG TPA: T9SS type A sorting domain-containing protein [Ignavibacteriaceae bacterium]|nr:T9SS type A sorting domain-containing protein [Ignavibacteriaceae bacterium]